MDLEVCTNVIQWVSWVGDFNLGHCTLQSSVTKLPHWQGMCDFSNNPELIMFVFVVIISVSELTVCQYFVMVLHFIWWKSVMYIIIQDTNFVGCYITQYWWIILLRSIKKQTVSCASKLNISDPIFIIQFVVTICALY